MVIAIHDPIPSNYSIDTLCERFRAIELRRELRTTKDSGASDDPIAMLEEEPRDPREPAGDAAKLATTRAIVAPRNRRGKVWVPESLIEAGIMRAMDKDR